MQYCSYISNTPACWNTCVSFNQSDIIYSCHLWIKRFPSTCTCTSHMQCTLFSISAILKYVARIHRSSAFQFRGTDHFSNKWQTALVCSFFSYISIFDWSFMPCDYWRVCYLCDSSQYYGERKLDSDWKNGLAVACWPFLMQLGKLSQHELGLVSWSSITREVCTQLPC